YGQPIQCRAGHAFLGEYHFAFVPRENPSCPKVVGNPFIPGREHIITSCPIFESKHGTLRAASEDLILTDLLRMEKGIEALIDFLNETRATSKKANRANSQPHRATTILAIGVPSHSSICL
ncbi:hypothetical protein EDD16DRAFT_1477534, partial [Pisolithus croceorrhizus]